MQQQLLIASLAVVCYVLYLVYIISREHKEAARNLVAPRPDAAIERLESDLASLDSKVSVLEEKVKALNKNIVNLECGVPSRPSGTSGSSQRESKQPFSI